MKKLSKIVLTCIVFLLFAASAQAEDGTLRVYLKSFGSIAELDMRLDGSYSVNDEVYFAEGTDVRALQKGGKVWLRCGPVGICAGDSVTLDMHESTGGIVIDGRQYVGSLKLTASETGLVPVLYIDIEEYVKGVIPYEMSDSFPIEALKAQAVAARTYALYKRSVRADQTYDVVDTAGDQVFRGTRSEYVHAAEAAQATKGIAGLYNGAYALCYFTASNGGRVALPSDTLDASDMFYQIKEDPYDYANPASAVRTLAFMRDMTDAPEKLKTALAKDGGEAAYIRSVTAAAPVNAENERYTQLRFDYVLRTYTDITVFDLRSHPEDLLTGKKLHKYGTVKAPLYEDCETDLPVYDFFKREMGLSINPSDTELVSVTEDEELVIIKLRRYGHGVGMSQCGAQYMAGEYGMKYEDILAFYYPGVTFEAHEYTTAIAQTAVVPTDVKLVPEAGETMASIKLANNASTLNMRQGPSTDTAVLCSLANGTEVAVMGIEGEWAHIRTGVAEGYVKTQYLEISGLTE